MSTYAREALSLYRDVLRACAMFRNVPHPSGVPQSVVIKNSARQEFEQGRHETDPEVILQLILGGRQALNEVKNRVADKFNSDTNKE